jgi:hypothetical protein
MLRNDWSKNRCRFLLIQVLLATLPALFSCLYADYFESVNTADLHQKNPEETLGWQFFPRMQLTQSLSDLLQLNEWKIVVAPLNLSSGQVFCIDVSSFKSQESP